MVVTAQLRHRSLRFAHPTPIGNTGKANCVKKQTSHQLSSAILLAHSLRSDENCGHMKWRAFLTLVVFGAGVATGYFGAQPDIQKRFHATVMTAGELVEVQIDRVLEQVRGKETSDPQPDAQPATPILSTSPSDAAAMFADYLRSFVHVTSLQARREGVGAAVIISGKLSNSGTRTLTKVDAAIYFMGAEEIVFETKLPLVTDSPLPANSTRDFSWRIDNVPLEWAGRVRGTVTAIQF